ncbi:MAG TPA: zinc-binding dehydrogenase [Candidatus Sulfotelmatobacter sp.]|nr:zinc-binding dehydrogenase [Candidatus Sulfotelmatobacter sp.]
MTGLELRSKITSAGELQLWLEEVAVPEPGPDQVVLRVEAAPINPSDLGLLLGPADLATLRAGGTPERPTITASVPHARLALVEGRLDQAMPVGNEGAGVVVTAGGNAQTLLGRTLAARAGGMYAQYRLVNTADTIPLPEGTRARDGASAFVNPLTALGMLETMRREGHRALVHTAAASNLGQMLVRLCRADDVPLVNIVRSKHQETLLRELGATHVVDSSSPTFVDDLTDAVAETGATLAFDAIGGGTLASTILTCMERVAGRRETVYSRYGSTVHKQVYLYGSLDVGPTVLNRNYGMAWGVGGWLVFSYLGKLGAETFQRLRDRVAAELTTTFASRYTDEISLTQALDPAVIAAYSKRATGEKYLVTPTKGA